MKALKKSLIGLAVSAACVAPAAIAATNNIGGVIWDPSVGNDFEATSGWIVQNINLSGVVSGYGYITTINGTGVGTFCPGCELTFTFSGFNPTGPLSVTNLYTGGVVNIFVDHTPDTAAGTSTNAANYGDGDLGGPWLTLAGHANSAGWTFKGTIGSGSLSGEGQLDVTGGTAQAAFDTNMMATGALEQLLNLPTYSGADMKFSTTFTNLTNFPGEATGSGTFSGASIAVPEPASLALVGLGLLGLAGARRRKSV